MSEVTIEPGTPVDDSTGEGEDDVLERLSAQRANVTATDWTIETIVRQLVRGRIDLEPEFQRRAAWTPALKSKFIESCILAYPIPQIVLAERDDRPGQFLVIDGKQRLLALRQFYAGLEEYNTQGFTPYRLSTVTVLNDIKNYTISRLQKERPELFDAFETHTIRTVVIRNWGSSDFLYTLFLRLNTGSVPLSPQELRQALEPGEFVKYVDFTSGESPGLRLLLGNSGPDRRMIDAELLTRLIGLFVPGVSYAGNLKTFLDKTCAHFNDTWDSAEITIADFVTEMELAIVSARIIFGPGVCRKWTRDHYERQFNRALFDVQVGSLLEAQTRKAALDHADALLDASRQLFDDDPAFVRSITSTTKTVDAFNSRFSAWWRVFESITSVGPIWPVNLPDKR